MNCRRLGFVGFNWFKQRAYSGQVSTGTRIGVMILDVVVMDVSRIDVAVMGSNSVDCSCMGDLGVRIEGGHNGRVVETVAVDDDGVGVHCRRAVPAVGVTLDDRLRQRAGRA